MSEPCVQARIASLQQLIPRPPADIVPLRGRFSRTVSREWDKHVPGVLAACECAISGAESAKARFIAQMYARACYSMLLISATQQPSIAAPVRIATALPLTRKLAISIIGVLIDSLGHLFPARFHRRLLLMSALMGFLDVVLDDVVARDDGAALRIGSLFGSPVRSGLSDGETMIAALVSALRKEEMHWHKEHWEQTLHPAVEAFCRAEVQAFRFVPDPDGMGHRAAGLNAALAGMWYAIGPSIGIAANQHPQRNGIQTWMAETALLMQMIDDWADQDDDRNVRLTATVCEDWTLDSAAQLYAKTVQDLRTLLVQHGIRSPTLTAAVSDLYADFLYAAMEAMNSGVAA